MGEWITIKSESDIPRKNCFLAFVLHEDYCGNNEIENMANLYAGVGFLSWSSDFSYGSITEDGEVVYLNEVAAICQIPSPIGLKIERKL